jgi:pyridoxamine 5'-phosphate oxidase
LGNGDWGSKKNEMSDSDFGEDRREYGRKRLDESSAPDDPIRLLVLWLEDARKSGTTDPTAMTLSTVGSEGNPSSRIVLLKKIEAGKLLFFTSMDSRKSRDIITNAHVALHFYWPELERQVKLAGKAQKIEESEANHYFQSRPFESKLAAWVSPQSEVIPNRSYLEDAFEKKRQEYKEEDLIPKPPQWGGYAVSPLRIEFWQGGKHRLHDRLEYLLEEGLWKRVRLAP